MAAPLDLAGLLHEQLYERKRSIVLTSATLSVRDAAADAGSGFAALSLAPRLPPRPSLRKPGDDEADFENAEDLSPPEISV